MRIETTAENRKKYCCVLRQILDSQKSLYPAAEMISKKTKSIWTFEDFGRKKGKRQNIKGPTNTE